MAVETGGPGPVAIKLAISWQFLRIKSESSGIQRYRSYSPVMSVYPTSPPKMTYSRTADKHADAVPREGFN